MVGKLRETKSSNILNRGIACVSGYIFNSFSC